MSTKTHGRMVTDGSISSDNLADDAVTSAKIAAGAVGTTDIADNSITGAKIALGGDTTGDIMYYDGTNWVRSPTNLSFPGGRSVYDISFLAGYDAETVPANVVLNQIYAEMVMSRTGIFDGEVGYIDTVCTGAALICDVLKNGQTIYSTKPQFAVSTPAMTAGTLSTTTFSSGDRITFKVTQIGSSAVGQGVRFMLNCKV